MSNTYTNHSRWYRCPRLCALYVFTTVSFKCNPVMLKTTDLRFQVRSPSVVHSQFCKLVV